MKNILAAGASLLLAGCATIFVGQTQAVVIQSMPENAEVTVTNRAGMQVHSGTTPMTVTLRRGAGYFRAETYKIRFSKGGYVVRELQLTSTVGGWYFGNIVFGGLVGMLAVDPATGAMYSFPKQVQGTLDPVPTAGAIDRTLKIVSTASLTAEQMREARLLAAAD